MPEPTCVPLPPWRMTEEGRTRNCGVELEFSGLDIDTIAELARAQLGGSVERVSPYEYRLTGTPLGTFAIELDFAYLKKVGRQADEREAGVFDIDKLSEDLLAMVAKRVVPFEVVSPPLPMDRLAVLEPLIARLREAGALGTGHAVVYAFGLHLNPEMPRLDSETIVAYLRAFLCLYEWLLRVSGVDWSRRLTPYIRPYAKEYVRQVVAEDYRPGLTALIDDYLAANPERNRALDLLPLFAHLDPARVGHAVKDPRIQARPTLHYRLPNCDIDRAGWGILEAWRHWLQVEHLASDAERLARFSARYREFLDRPIEGLVGDWAQISEQWLLDEADL
jgi:hypothetical protein